MLRSWNIPYSEIFCWSYQSNRIKFFFIILWRNPIYPTPPLGQDMTQGQFLSGVYQVWIQSFPSPRLVASPRLKNLVCPTILPIAGGRIIGFIPFPRVSVLCEMQSASSRIWTRVAVSISYDDNHYTTGTFWCNGERAGLLPRSKWVRFPVAILHSVSDKPPWENYEHLFILKLWAILTSC